MIEFAQQARRNVQQLNAHYRRINRPEAIRNLSASLARMTQAIENGTARPRAYPATYTEMRELNKAWIKDGRYWLGYSPGDPPVVIAVFWDGADIARRYTNSE